MKAGQPCLSLPQGLRTTRKNHFTPRILRWELTLRKNDHFLKIAFLFFN
jgi:hypothetical protein